MINQRGVTLVFTALNKRGNLLNQIPFFLLYLYYYLKN